MKQSTKRFDQTDSESNRACHPSSPDDLLEVKILDNRRIADESRSAGSVIEGRVCVRRRGLRGRGRDPRVEGRRHLGDGRQARGRHDVHGQDHRGRSPAPGPARATESEFGGWDLQRQKFNFNSSYRSLSISRFTIEHPGLAYKTTPVDCLCTQRPNYTCYPTTCLPSSSVS